MYRHALLQDPQQYSLSPISDRKDGIIPVSEKILIFVIDGCPTDYITPETTPNLYRLGQDGFLKTVLSAMPSVTNVNHATILTGDFPARHRVVGNYYYDRATGAHGFIESSHHMKADSILDLWARQGRSTALLTVKGKVLEVFGDHVDIGINLQRPTAEQLKRYSLPAPPAVDSLDTYDWIFRACYQVMSQDDPDLVYCTTNDYMMHNYAPDTPEARAVMGTIDRWIGAIYDLDPAREIYLTADHGMGAKSRVINIQKKLDQAGFHTYCLLPLKDRYLANHRFQEGGTVYVYVLDPQERDQARTFLEGQDYVQSVLPWQEAAERFRLPADPDAIGDLVALAPEDIAFGELEGDEAYAPMRTHGSLYEREIPLIAVNARRGPEAYAYSADIVRHILADTQEICAAGDLVAAAASC